MRAAQRLHISQPPLSVQMKELESELGAKLFERSPRGIELTPEGEVFYAEAVSILARVEHAKILVARTASGEAGLLSVGFVSIADYSVLPATLAMFRQRYPGVDVQLNELTTDAQIKELVEESIDVGIALAPVVHPALKFTPAHREALILALPEDHRVARLKEPIDLASVATEPFVFIPRIRAPGLYDAMISCCSDAGFVPRIAQYAKQMQTVISLVAGGFGVALVPASLTNLVRRGVVYKSLRHVTHIEVGLLHRINDTRRALQYFMDCVAEAEKTKR